MKNIGIVVFVGLIILNMITYKSCTSYKEKYKSELDRVTDLYDRVDSIFNIPPDTIILPSEVIKGKDSIVYITKWKEKPNKPELEPQIYKDSIISDSIDIRYEIIAEELYEVKFNCKPIWKYQTKLIEKKIPQPFEVIKEIKVPKSGLFIQAGLGYGKDDIAAKVGIMYLTKKQSTISYDLIRYGDNNISLLSYGVKF